MAASMVDQATITSEVVLVTPEIAAEWLEKFNTENYRQFSKRTATKLADAIRRDEWRLNGESIKFDWNGKLADGQHRLSGIVDAGIAVPVLVVRGIEPESSLTMDTGKRRTLPDALRAHGVAQAYNMASTLALLHRYENSLMKDRATYPTIQQALALFNRHSELPESVTFGGNLYKQVHVPLAWGALGHYVFSHIDAHDADVFFMKLFTGVGLEDGDPILTMRGELFKRPYQPLRSQRRTAPDIGAKLFKAWNYWRMGKTIKYLSWRPGGRAAEPFPKAI